MQSFENINNLPFTLDLPIRQAKQWTWPEIRFNPMEKYTKFLRYPGPADGAGYWVMRWGVLSVLQASAFFRSLGFKRTMRT